MTRLSPPEGAVTRDQAFATIEDRIRLLTFLADWLAHEREHQDKVMAARDCILALRQDLGKLRVRRGAAPKATQLRAEPEPSRISAASRDLPRPSQVAPVQAGAAVAVS